MEYINKLTLDKKIILLMVLSLAFPYYINVPIYTGILLYIITSKQFLLLTQGINKYFYLFLGIITITSIFNKNIYGLLGCFAFLLIFTLIFFYQLHTDRELFEVCLDIMIVVSIIWGIISFFQYLNILSNNDISGFVIKIFARRENRISGAVYNANYYSSAIELVMLIICYKIINTKNRKLQLIYSFAFLWNAFFLLLSGCRTGWLSLAVAIIIFLILNKKHIVTFGCLALGISVIIYFLFNIDKIPRIEYLAGNLSVRGLIWSTAIKGIQENPFFGQGPFTYMLIFEQYAGHPTQHAHSLLLEPLLSFGIIGCTPFFLYFMVTIKKIISYYQKNYVLVSLILAAIINTIIHGLTDYTIFFVHPGMIFMIIVTSHTIIEGK